MVNEIEICRDSTEPTGALLCKAVTSNCDVPFSVVVKLLAGCHRGEVS